MLVCVLPIQRLDPRRPDVDDRRAARDLDGRLLLVLLIALTLLPFLSLFTTALHPSGTYPLGLDWPSDPQWSNFVDAFDVAQMGSAALVEHTIVLGVVPVAVLIATMAGFAIGHLRIPGGRFAVPRLPARSDAAVRRHHHAAVLPGARPRAPEHQVGDHPAADRPVHALRRLLDAGPLREHAARTLGGGAGRRREYLAPVLADPCPARSTPAISSLAILLFLWTWNQFLLALVLVDDPTKRTMAGALAPFRVNGAPTSRSSALGRC